MAVNEPISKPAMGYEHIAKPEELDAVTVLLADHREIQRLIGEYRQSTEKAHKIELVEHALEHLARHEEAEEQKFWPKVRKALPEGDRLVDERLAEEHASKVLAHEIERLSPEDARWEAIVETLISGVLEHIEHEERKVFPKVRAGFNLEKLSKLGHKLEKAKKHAPTHAHPHAPDTPPGNTVAGIGAKVVDTVDDLGQLLKEDVSG